jgi:hypothetical protein
MAPQTQDQEKRYTYQEYKDTFFPEEKSNLPTYDDPYEMGAALAKIIMDRVREKRKASEKTEESK